MSKKTDQLSSLLADYPELGAGLSQLMEEEGSEVTGMVGIYTLLKLRLRAVVSLLPRPGSDEESRPHEGGGTAELEKLEAVWDRGKAIMEKE